MRKQEQATPLFRTAWNKAVEAFTELHGPADYVGRCGPTQKKPYGWVLFMRAYPDDAPYTDEHIFDHGTPVIVDDIKGTVHILDVDRPVHELIADYEKQWHPDLDIPQQPLPPTSANYYWRLSCDDGHEWTLLLPDKTIPKPEDYLCAFGHDAVMRSLLPVPNSVQVSIRPAAYIGYRDNVYLDGEYYLVVSNLCTGNERMSKQTYSWEEAYSLIPLLNTTNIEDAVKAMEAIDESH